MVAPVQGTFHTFSSGLSTPKIQDSQIGCNHQHTHDGLGNLRRGLCPGRPWARPPMQIVRIHARMPEERVSAIAASECTEQDELARKQGKDPPKVVPEVRTALSISLRKPGCYELGQGYPRTWSTQITTEMHHRMPPPSKWHAPYPFLNGPIFAPRFLFLRPPLLLPGIPCDAPLAFPPAVCSALPIGAATTTSRPVACSVRTEGAYHSPTASPTETGHVLPRQGVWACGKSPVVPPPKTRGSRPSAALSDSADVLAYCCFSVGGYSTPLWGKASKKASRREKLWPWAAAQPTNSGESSSGVRRRIHVRMASGL
jgi:hypothetical protein